MPIYHTQQEKRIAKRCTRHTRRLNLNLRVCFEDVLPAGIDISTAIRMGCKGRFAVIECMVDAELA